MKPISIPGTRLLGRVAVLASALTLAATLAPAANAPTRLRRGQPVLPMARPVAAGERSACTCC